MCKIDKAGMHANTEKGFRMFSPKLKYLYIKKLKDNFHVLKVVKPKRPSRDELQSKNIGKESLYNSTYALERNNVILWHGCLGAL